MVSASISKAVSIPHLPLNPATVPGAGRAKEFPCLQAMDSMSYVMKGVQDDCRHGLAKLPPPSVEEVRHKIQQLTLYNYHGTYKILSTTIRCSPARR